jgi:hypothetical protein
LVADTGVAEATMVIVEIIEIVVAVIVVTAGEVMEVVNTTKIQPNL